MFDAIIFIIIFFLFLFKATKCQTHPITLRTQAVSSTSDQ